MGCRNAWEKVARRALAAGLRQGDLVLGGARWLLASGIVFLLMGAGSGLRLVPPWLHAARGCPGRVALAGGLPLARWPQERPTGTI